MLFDGLVRLGCRVRGNPESVAIIRRQFGRREPPVRGDGTARGVSAHFRGWTHPAELSPIGRALPAVHADRSGARDR